LGGKFHLKLNIGEKPIANKYREGKVKRTLKRELKVLEIVKREGIGISIHLNWSIISYEKLLNFSFKSLFFEWTLKLKFFLIISGMCTILIQWVSMSLVKINSINPSESLK